MSGDTADEATPRPPEYECLLQQRADVERTFGKDTRQIQHVERRSRAHDRLPRTLFGVSRSIQDVSVESNSSTTMEQSNRAVTTTTLPTPSIVVDDVDRNVNVHDDDPPPYTVVPPPNHIGWSYDFTSGIPYSVHTGPPRVAETSLASFQASLASGANVRTDGSGQHSSSIPMPFTSYRFFKFGSNRTLFTREDVPMTDGGIATKTVGGKSRRYGAILVAGAVIIFLMALSLMVRFVVERSFWRG